MDAKTRTPWDIFGNQQQYVVPVFQRPYVWNRTDQWEPLWRDVATVTEKLLAVRHDPNIPPHFLGAVVIGPAENPAGSVQTRPVIDGQQRLTTLQLLMDAVQEVVLEHGDQHDAANLANLVLNPVPLAPSSDERFKVWPTDKDRAAFRAAMDNDTVTPQPLKNTRIVQAHVYFRAAAASWALENGPSEAKQRLAALVHGLRSLLMLVVIDLGRDDDPQAIFESLNARGTPLAAFDLAKNFVFQEAKRAKLDVQKLYDSTWAKLDTDAWRAEVSRGRDLKMRVDVFMRYWLIMRTKSEVLERDLYRRFCDYVKSNPGQLVDIVGDLVANAEVFDQLAKQEPGSVEERFYYRIVKVMEFGVVTPLVLWLLEKTDDDAVLAQRRKALLALESWIVRRAICRNNSKDLNNVVLQLLIRLDGTGREQAGDETAAHLAAEEGEYRDWPGDALFVSRLASRPLYRDFTITRVRMILEALEEAKHTSLSCTPNIPRNLTIEHIMPQTWEDYWNDDSASLDPDAKRRRDEIIHTLGNLTLVNNRLNPTLSNRPWQPWSDVEAYIKRFRDGRGKREILQDHATLKLTWVAVNGNESWDEAHISDRGQHLAALALQVWKRPASTGK